MRSPSRSYSQSISQPWKLLFELHRQPVGQRALACVLVEQEGFARVELVKCADDLVQLGLHDALHEGER